MNSMLTRFGDVVLQKVAPQAAADAVCVTTRQWRCAAIRCWVDDNGIVWYGEKQYRDCYDGTSCSGCNSWKKTGCC